MVKVLRDLSLSDKKGIARSSRRDFIKKYDDILNNLKDVEVFQTKNNSFYGQYNPTLHTAYISNSVPLSNKTLRLSTGIHEVGSHGALRGSRNMPNKMGSEITSSFLPKDVLSKIASSTDDPLRFTAKQEIKDPYFTTDYETHARLLETRLHSGNFPQGQLDWNHFQKAVDAGVLDKDFTKLIINKDKFVRDANKYSSMLPIIPSLNNTKTESYQKGGSMLKHQFNLFQKQKLSKRI